MNLDIGQMATQLIGLLEDRRAVIGVLGMGYVGQPLALRYAELGYKVIGFDIDAEKVADLNAGRSHIEHISDADIRRANAAGLECTTDYSRAAEADALIRILNALADRLYPMLRSLLSSAEPAEITAQRWQLFRSRLDELLRERFNLRRGAVQRLLDPQEGPALSRDLIQAMALSAGPGGFERLKASLLDAAS